MLLRNQKSNKNFFTGYHHQHREKSVAMSAAMAPPQVGGTTTAPAPAPSLQTFISGALMVTVGLAWSSAVQGTFDAVLPHPTASVVGKLAYAGVLTGACLASIQILNQTPKTLADLQESNGKLKRWAAKLTKKSSDPSAPASTARVSKWHRHRHRQKTKQPHEKQTQHVIATL